jgi:hypothetical protein
MSLRSEDMLVNGHVYSTGTARAEPGAQAKEPADLVKPAQLYWLPGNGYYPVCDR